MRDVEIKALLTQRRVLKDRLRYPLPPRGLKECPPLATMGFNWALRGVLNDPDVPVSHGCFCAYVFFLSLVFPPSIALRICRVMQGSITVMPLPGSGFLPLGGLPALRGLPALHGLLPGRFLFFAGFPLGSLPFAGFHPFMGSLSFLPFVGFRPSLRGLPALRGLPSLFRAVWSLF